VSEALELLSSIVRASYVPESDEEVWQWADSNVVLDASMTAHAGYYDSTQTPWVREFNEAARDDTVDEVWAMKSSRSGYTEASLNSIRAMGAGLTRPGNILYMIDSDREAEKISRQRLEPTLGRAVGKAYDQAKVKIHTIRLRNFEITIAGSGAKGALAQTYYRNIYLDELELHNRTEETTTADRARSRMATLPPGEGQLYGFSKPELEDGPIHKQYKRGDQRRYMVPCPGCGHRQTLEWERLRFAHCVDETGEFDDAMILSDTWYECANVDCTLPDRRIEESHKFEMNMAGEWAPTPERDRDGGGRAIPGVRSYQISDLYSNYERLSWGRLAVMWVERFKRSGASADQKYFVNNHLGLPWKEENSEVKENDIMRLRGGTIIRSPEGDGKDIKLGEPFDWVYMRGEVTGAEIPFDPYSVTVTVDKQQDRYKFLVVAWKSGGECYPIDYGELFDDEDVLDLLDRPYPVAGTEPVYIYRGLVDCGFKPTVVYELCRRSGQIEHGFRLMPSRGIGHSRSMAARAYRFRVEPIDGGTIAIVDYNDSILKSWVYHEKIGARQEPRLWMPESLTPQWMSELTAEKLVKEVDKNGFPVERWVKTGANDYGDTLKMQYLLWRVVHGGRRNKRG